MTNMNFLRAKGTERVRSPGPVAGPLSYAVGQGWRRGVTPGPLTGAEQRTDNGNSADEGKGKQRAVPTGNEGRTPLSATASSFEPTYTPLSALSMGTVSDSGPIFDSARAPIGASYPYARGLGAGTGVGPASADTRSGPSGTSRQNPIGTDRPTSSGKGQGKPGSYMLTELPFSTNYNSELHEVEASRYLRIQDVACGTEQALMYKHLVASVSLFLSCHRCHCHCCLRCRCRWRLLRPIIVVQNSITFQGSLPPGNVLPYSFASSLITCPSIGPSL